MTEQAVDRDLVVIEPPNSAAIFADLREVFRFRELLLTFIIRDLKVRYKQTILGFAWALLQPLASMAVFTVIFSRVAGIGGNGLPYPLFAYTGLVVWLFFSTAVTSGGNSLVNSAHLITKVYFPRLVIPAAVICSSLVDFGVALLLLIPLLLRYRIGLAPTAVLAIPLVALLWLLAFAVAAWLAALNVKYRDIRHALPFAMQMWMFASPVAYPLNALPQRLQPIVRVNPVTGIVENLRAALFGLQPFDGPAIALAAGETGVLLVIALIVFRRLESRFADVV